jgi:hypothetical protein
MFPKPQRHPSGIFEGCIDIAIALNVSLKLRTPIRGVGTWRDAVHRALMPETSVDEDSDAAAREDHIRPDDAMPEPDGQVDPETEPARVEGAAQEKLRLCPSLPICLHDVADRGIRCRRDDYGGHVPSVSRWEVWLVVGPGG